MDPVDFYDSLFKAVVDRNIDLVCKLLSQVDMKNEIYQQALMSGFLESATRDVEICRLFLDMNFDIDSVDDVGDTALMAASQGEDGYIFDKEDEDENIPDAPAPFIESLQAVEELLKRGASVDLVNNSGESALIQSVMISGHPEIVRLLLDAKCNVEIADKKGYTALHYAAVRGCADAIQLLLPAYNDKNHRTNDGDTALYLACTNGDLATVNTLLQHGIDVNATNNSGQSALIAAATYDSIEIIQELLKHGVDDQIRDMFGMTALHHAVYSGSSLDVVECLIQAGMDVNNKCEDEIGNSILHDAVTGTKPNVVEFLIKSGANVNAINTEGKTPVMLANAVEKHEIIQVLVANGATLEP